MSDDLDDLIRRAMKTLDDQAPSGYFEALPSRTLARLEDSSMQPTSTGNASGSGQSGKASGVPPQQERDEDSGLHDIRSMASSTKMRLSKRTSTHPPIDEDILASSSAGWKAVALPEPAKMVSLPDIADLPPVEEVKAERSERKSKKELKAERISAKQIAKEAVSVESSPVLAPKPKLDEPAPVAAAASSAPVIGARFTQKQKPKAQGSKTGLYALVGVGLAAAAGVGWYVSTQMGDKKPATDQVAVAQERAVDPKLAVTAAAPAPAAGSAAVTATPIEEPKAEPVATGMATDSAAAVGGEDRNKDEDKVRHASKGGKHNVKKDDSTTTTPDAAEVKKPDAPPAKDKKGGTGEEGEPSFDALLKEAGVPEGQKQKKVVLEKKSLSGADIKKGMGAVTAKAQACYAGTQGSAGVRLTVLPTGQIEKVTITGVFAGTPVGACVESAVKGATFPPWDGGPQTFGYSYLLAE
jgi:hypothetical protein